MKTQYKIKETDNLSTVVYSISFDSPMNYLGSIENDLFKKGIKGQITFDLLLSNGNTSDRFYEMYFDGKKLQQKTLHKIHPSKDLQTESTEFYSKNTSYLENSVLSKAEKFIVKKNLNFLLK